VRSGGRAPLSWQAMGGARSKLAVLGAALAILAAGCGGGGGGNAGSGDQSQSFTPYETAMQRLGQQLGAAITAAGNKNISATSASIEKNLRKVQVELRSTAAKLQRITPPDKIKADHQLMIHAVREYADELNGVISRVQNGNTGAALNSILSLKGLKDMQRASQAITKAGYVIVVP